MGTTKSGAIERTARGKRSRWPVIVVLAVAVILLICFFVGSTIGKALVGAIFAMMQFLKQLLHLFPGSH